MYLIVRLHFFNFFRRSEKWDPMTEMRFEFLLPIIVWPNWFDWELKSFLLALTLPHCKLFTLCWKLDLPAHYEKNPILISFDDVSVNDSTALLLFGTGTGLKDVSTCEPYFLSSYKHLAITQNISCENNSKFCCTSNTYRGYVIAILFLRGFNLENVWTVHL